MQSQIHTSQSRAPSKALKLLFAHTHVGTVKVTPAKVVPARHP